MNDRISGQAGQLVPKRVRVKNQFGTILNAGSNK
jgi:hypothetical protein